MRVRKQEFRILGLGDVQFLNFSIIGLPDPKFSGHLGLGW